MRISDFIILPITFIVILYISIKIDRYLTIKNEKYISEHEKDNLLESVVKELILELESEP